MKKRVSVLLVLTVLLSVLFALPASAEVNIPEPTDQFYVNDFAGVLSDETKNGIMSANINLYEKTGGQIVVTTVDFLDNADISDYGYAMFNQWKIGSKEKNNGILLLLAIGDDNYRVIPGYGIEDELSAGELKQMLNEYLEPDFAAKDYDAGVQKMFTALVNWYESNYGVSISSTAGALPDPKAEYQGGGGVNEYEGQRSGGFSRMFSSIIMLIILFVVFSSIFSRRRRYRGYPPYGGGYGGRGYYGGGSWFWPFFLGNLWGSSRRPPPPWDDNRDHHHHDDHDDHDNHGGWFGGGGGFGGFGGGGGGGFSGGGGGSSGGGAGRF